MADGRIVIETGLDSSGIEAGLGKMQGLVAGGARAAMTSIAAVSTAIAGATVAAANAGMSFESAFAGVKKTVEASDQELAIFRQGIRDMAKDMPTSANEIAGVAEAAGQLGIKNDSILSFTETMVMLGDSTDMSAEVAATSLARLANITGMPQANFDRLGATIVALGNNLATTESEISAMGLRLAGAGSQVGLSEEQIMSFAAALSSVGIEAEAGGSAFSKVMVDMQLAAETGGDSLDSFAGVAGMSSADFAKAFKTDAAGAMMSFIQGLSTCDERGISAIKTLDDMGISEVRMRDALLRAAGASDVFTEALAIGSEAWEDNTALTDEAGQRYETLESKLGMLKNQAVDLGISLFDGMNESLRGAVAVSTAYIEQLANAFQDGGLNVAVEAAGDIFADIAVRAAESAPGMIDAAVSVIEAFVKGLASNKARIGKAALDIATSLANGLIKLLPKQMQKPAQEAIAAMSKSLTSGGLKSAIDTVCRMFDGLVTVVGNIAQVVLPPLTGAIDFAGQHLDLLAGAAAGVATAFVAWKVVEGVSKTIGSINTVAQAGQLALAAFATQNGIAAVSTATATGAMTVQQTVVAGLTGKIGLATAAQNLWNFAMTANPIGLVITAVAALAAGIGIYCLATDDGSETTSVLTDEQLRLNESTRESADAYLEMKAARDEQMAGINAEYGYTQSLADELDTLVDENGRVKEGCEERANVITGVLSEALGIEIEQVGGVIQEYDKLKASIDTVILTKKAEAVQDSMAAGLAEALEKQTEACKEYAAAQKDAEENSRKLATAEAERQAIQDKIDSAPDRNFALVEYGQGLADAETKVSQLSDAQGTLDETLGAAETAYVGFQTTIANHEGVASAIASGDADQIQQALAKATRSFQTSKTGTATTLSAQMMEMGQSYEDMKALVESGTAGVTQAAVDEAQAMYYLSRAEYEKATGGNERIIKDWTDRANELFANSGNPDAAKENAAETGDTVVDQLEEDTPRVEEAAGDQAEGINRGADSVETKKKGKKKAKESTEGKVEGLQEGKEPVNKASAEATEEINKGSESVDTKTSGKKAGEESVQALVGALDALKGTVETAAKAIADAFTGGVEGESGNAGKAGTKLAEASKTGIESVKATSVGEKLALQFTGAIITKSLVARSSGSTLANSAKGGLASVSALNAGIDFANGYIGGINSRLIAAQLAAATLARAALESMKRAQASASPSKKSKKLGNDCADGYCVGMKDKTKEVQKTAIQLTKKALKTLLSANGDYEAAGASAIEAFTDGLDRAVEKAQNKVESLLDKQVSKETRARADLVKKENQKLKDVYAKEKAALEDSITDDNKKTVEKQIRDAEQAMEKKVKANEKNLETLKSNYKKMGEVTLKAYSEALEEEARAVGDKLSETIDEITKEYQKKYDKIISLRDSMQGKLSGSSLFEREDGEIVLTDMNAELQKIARYGQNMNQLKGKISADMLAEVAEMNVEDAIAYSDRLLQMSETDLKRYAALYDKKNAAAKEVSRKFYQAELAAIQTEFTGKINAAFATAKKEMESVGKNVAQGFIDGLQSQTKKLTNAVKKLSKEIIKQVKKDFGINSPAKEFRGIARDCTDGYELEYRDGMRDASKAVAKSNQGVLATAKKTLDYSTLAAQMRAGIAAENARMTQRMSTLVNYRVSGTLQLEEAATRRQQTKLGDEIVSAFARSGIGIKWNMREFGRLIKEVR